MPNRRSTSTDHSESRARARLAADLQARLAPVRDAEDGTIFWEQSGPQYVVVTKEESNVLLWLMDRHNPSSGVIQSELNLDDPLDLVDPYTQAAFVALLWNSAPKRIFMTGVGGGCLANALHCVFPFAQIDCVEIDAVVLRAAQRCFGFHPDATLHAAVDDGRAWLERTAEHPSYDLLIVDAFLDHGYAPYRMATVEFATLCRERLAPDGVLVVNLLYLGYFNTERIKTLASIFEHLYLLRMGEDNDILFASRRPVAAAAVEEISLLQDQLAFRFSFLHRMDAFAPVTPAEIPGWEEAVVLTDAAAPPGYFDVMPVLVDPAGASSPDAPCLCGSGRRYAECHGHVLDSAAG